MVEGQDIIGALCGGGRVAAPVAIVAAHPDDEVLGLGGCLGRLANVTLIHLTDGAPRDGNDARRAGYDTRRAYAAARRGELAAALDTLGIQPARVIDYASVDQEAILDIGAIVARLVRDLDGTAAVFTHPYEHGHPDHDTAALAVTLACRRLAAAGQPPPLHCEFASYHRCRGETVYGAFWDDPECPIEVHVLSAEGAAAKSRALACFASQRDVIAPFPRDRELFRQAPAYDFSSFAPPGESVYASFGWAMTPAEWRARAFETARHTPAARPLRVLNVAYPFAPVSADPVGGAEQILSRLDRALAAAGHDSAVLAADGSVVAGRFHPLPPVPTTIDDAHRAQTHVALRREIAALVDRHAFDLVHYHGIDFAEYRVPQSGVPALVTTHLPLSWYSSEALRPCDNEWLQPVSATQAATAPAEAPLLPPIANGVDIDPPRLRRRAFCVGLGRACPEKGFDDALAAARLADVPLLLAGVVFPYPAHEAFFRTRIQPRLDCARRWIGAVQGRAKARLLAQARCVLIPSKAAETSSLVAMEAMAAGAPTVAYRSGALPEVIEEERTGLLVTSVAEMAAAIPQIDRIDPAVCRDTARRRFAAERMTRAYLRRYAAHANVR